MVHGLPGRGRPGDGAWRWAKGHGYVAPAAGAYARAVDAGCDVKCLLFETWGGWSPEVVELFRELAEERQNRLHKREYDETTWSARTWLSFQAQKISIALQYAVALELTTRHPSNYRLDYKSMPTFACMHSRMHDPRGRGVSPPAPTFAAQQRY